MKKLFSVIPLWQRRVMLSILVVGLVVIWMNDGYDFNAAEFSMSFLVVFGMVCTAYAWVLQAYRKP
jgi:hypothetical protein